MKTNKYLYVYVVQGYYTLSYGWEDLTESENYKEARDDLKAYRQNDPYPTRMIKRRVLNPARVVAEAEQAEQAEQAEKG